MPTKLLFNLDISTTHQSLRFIYVPPISYILPFSTRILIYWQRGEEIIFALDTSISSLA